MDRVLLIIDDIQYSRHIEMTLRKVGFELESINNEFSINESILSFNPDYIVCRGQSNRLSTLNIAKKIKDQHSKSNAKVILIFGENFRITPDEMHKIKMDLVLFEPVSTLRLAVHLFSFSGGDIEFIKDKLLKFAITDNQFRNYEQTILRNAGLTIDSEIQTISDMNEFSPPDQPMTQTEKKAAASEAPVYISAEDIKKLGDEIKDLAQELPLRIDSYNRIINKVDQDLSVGLNKRQTKQVSKTLQQDLNKEQGTGTKELNALDEERINFTKALFKKS